MPAGYVAHEAGGKVNIMLLQPSIVTKADMTHLQLAVLRCVQLTNRVPPVQGVELLCSVQDPHGDMSVPPMTGQRQRAHPLLTRTLVCFNTASM